MKLAFCLFKYFPYSGLSKDFLRILQECHDRGHELHVYVFEWQGEKPSGIKINVLSVLPLANHTQNASFYTQFKQQIALKEFDAIIGFNKMPGLDIYYGADYCYIARAVPRYGQWYRLTPRFRNFYSFEKAVFDVRSSTTILSLSEREKGVYQQHYGTPENRFELLPPTLDISRKLTDELADIRATKRQELSISDDESLLLFIGSGFKTKGLDRAIKAVASLPEKLKEKTQLLVIGQDSEHTFQRLVAKMQLNEHVRFMGGRDDILEIMTAGDVLIHPAYSETTGTVLIEAIAAGLPVLATDVCGFAPHISKADAGIVLRSPFVQKELNENLCTMMQSDDRQRWHDNGIAYGANPDLYRMPQTVSDLIERWVENKQDSSLEVEHQTKEVDDAHIYIRKKTPPRWAVKDIAGLYFSSKDIGLSSRDLFRFMKLYRSVSLREVLSNDPLFWKRVKHRGDKLYESEKRRAQSPQGLSQAV